ncbi:hypothetical protein XENOCAPTIV_006220, partial [Xenoophorus captivus]
DLSAEEDVTYQLRMTLFDRKLQHFFGKTWKSSPQKMKNSKIPFNEVTFSVNDCSCKFKALIDWLQGSGDLL